MKKRFIWVFLAVIGAFIFYGIRYMNSPLISQEAVYGTYEESVSTEAYFVRDESVYSARTSGTVYNSYSDGTRVKKDTLVATIYSGNVNEEHLQKLSTIDKKIENAKEASFSGFYGEFTDDSNLENRIDTYKYEIISSALEDDIGMIGRYKDAINSLRTGSTNQSNEEMISQLQKEKETVENQIGGTKHEIFTEQSGVFSTVLDGMEHILTPETATRMTVRDFEKISVPTEITANVSVVSGDSVCKIVNNHQWYVVCSIAAERLKEMDVNKSVVMRFDSIPGIDVSGKIFNISEEQDGKCIVVIQTSQYIESAYSIRQSSMELIFKSYEGYKIPVSAIRTEKDVQGVLARKNNVEKFYPCEILYTNKEAEYVIINSPDDAELKLDDVDEFVIGER